MEGATSTECKKNQESLDELEATLLSSMRRSDLKVETSMPTIIRAALNSSARPQTFSGPSTDRPFRTFLEEFEAYSSVVGYSDNDKLAEFSLYLRGSAHIYYANLEGEIKNDYDRLTKAFNQKYENFDELIFIDQELGDRRQGQDEPIDKYIEDIARLCWRLEKNPEEHKLALIRGFKHSIKEYVLPKRPSTVLECEIEAKLAERLVKMKNDNQVNCAMANLDKRIEDLTKRVSEMKVDSTSKMTPVNVQRERLPVPKCNKCSGFGHNAMNCRQNGQLKCHGCGRIGHLRRNCRSIKTKRKQ